MTEPQGPYRKPPAPPSRQTAARPATPRQTSRRNRRRQRDRAGSSQRRPHSEPIYSSPAPERPRRRGRPSTSRFSTLRATGGRTGRQTLPPLPRAPKPVLIGIRLLVLGIGVAALAGTLLSVITPADVQLGTPNPAPTASRTESVVMAKNRPTEATGLTVSQELTSLKAQLEALPELTPGLTQAIYVFDLDTGEYVDLAGQQPLAAASTIKLPILLAFFQEVDAGRITVEQIMTAQATQVVGGSGDMQGQPPGTQYTALEVATQMIINSDNTATNMMIDLLGGAESLNQRFQAWGLSHTQLTSPLPDLEGTNTTSPYDLVKVMAMLHKGELLRLRSRDRVLNILQRTYNKNLLPSGIEETALTYNKTGDIGSVLGDVALVDLPNGKRYAIAALVQRPENDGRAHELIRRISQTVSQEMAKAINPTLPPKPASDLDASGETTPETTPEGIPPSDDLDATEAVAQ
ncbi:MAG: serine hydrolase [Cyanobacteria bacterium P01_D01_bin.44]